MLLQKYQDYIAISYEGKEELFKTGYKFLEQMGLEAVIPGITITENGCPRVICPLEGRKSITAVLAGFQEFQAWESIIQILKLVKRMDENGFLCRESILIQPQNVFYDLKANRVQFIVVPKGSVEDYDKEKWIHDCMDLIYMLGERVREEKISEFYKKVIPVLERQQDFQILAGEMEEPAGENPVQTAGKQTLKIENADMGILFEICQEEFVLGKHPELTDGCIHASTAVSRRHCKVIRQAGEGYKVLDLGSVNGTFVNGIRVSSEVSTPLKNNDILRLADVELFIRMEEGV